MNLRIPNSNKPESVSGILISEVQASLLPPLTVLRYVDETPPSMAGEFREGYTEGTIFVEVAADAFVNSVDDASIDSAAEEIALTTARELARRNLAALGNTSQRMARLEGLPPIIQDVEPTIRKSGVRAWLSGG